MTKQQELILHIAANLGRLSRWALDGKDKRVNQFLEETVEFVDQLENLPKNERFVPTYKTFKKEFNILKRKEKFDKYWAEDALTWANILAHRAKLA